MKGYPKILKTKEDYLNCLAMVQAGTLEAAGLTEALDALEKRRYIESRLMAVSDDRKEVQIMYCAEAAIDAPFYSGTAAGTIKAVTNVMSADGADVPDTTTLKLSVAVPKDAVSICVMNNVDVLATVGMTEDDVKAIKGVLAQYE